MIGEWNGSTVARLIIMMMFCFNLQAEEIRFLTGSLSNGLSISFRSWVNQFQVMRHENSYCSIHYTYYSIMVKPKKMVVEQDFHTYLNNLCRVKKSDLFRLHKSLFFPEKKWVPKVLAEDLQLHNIPCWWRQAPSVKCPKWYLEICTMYVCCLW